MDYVRQLGSGATCSVWLARRKKKCVVVKRVAAAHLRAGARELAVLHRLRGDSGFVQLLHAELAATPKAGGLDIVLERCEGDLFARLQRQGSFTLSQARLWLHPVAGALQRLHRMGYVHGDVKPENILVRADGSTCLADFGITAKTLRGGQGTHEYMAPELLVGDGDERVDWWAFGILAHELVQGAPPWVHADAATLRRMITDARVAYTPRMPHVFRCLLEGLLQPNPRNRWTATRVLAHTFFRKE